MKKNPLHRKKHLDGIVSMVGSDLLSGALPTAMSEAFNGNKDPEEIIREQTCDLVKIRAKTAAFTQNPKEIALISNRIRKMMKTYS